VGSLNLIIKLVLDQYLSGVKYNTRGTED